MLQEGVGAIKCFKWPYRKMPLQHLEV